jgi:hypothetical protein
MLPNNPECWFGERVIWFFARLISQEGWRMQIISNRVGAVLQHLALPATIRLPAPNGVYCRLQSGRSSDVRLINPNITSSSTHPSSCLFRTFSRELKTPIDEESGICSDAFVFRTLSCSR